MASKLLREFSALAEQADQAGAGRDPHRPAAPPDGPPGRPEPVLTARELEVLTLVAQGFSNRAVA